MRLALGISHPPGWLGTDETDSLGCGSIVSPKGRSC